MKFSLRRDRKFYSPSLDAAMAGLQKVMEAQAGWLKAVEKDILTLEKLLSKSGAPLFASKAHGIAWAKWNKGKTRLIFCDDENLGPIVEGSPAQMMDAFQKLPDFLAALADHVQKLLTEEPLVSIVIRGDDVKRIGDE